MNITILAVGKIKDKPLEALQTEYCRRLRPYAQLKILEVRDEPNEHTDRPAEVKEIKDKEAARALERIAANDLVILLDLHGTEWTSEEFAGRLADWQLCARNLVFVIAGSLGPGEALLSRANVRWKLSSLTFTHRMTRIILLEQLYRACMIHAGRNYHK